MEKARILVRMDGGIHVKKTDVRGRQYKNAEKIINKLTKEGHVIDLYSGGDVALEKYDYIIGWNMEPLNWNTIYNQVIWNANRPPLIFAIIGESASGKTTIARELEEEYGIPELISYTTRPPRDKADDHIYLSAEDFAGLNDIIAYRSTGEYEYCGTREQLQGVNTYVIDEGGLKMLLKGDFEVVSIRIRCDDTVRRLRSHNDENRLKKDEGEYNMPDTAFDLVVDSGVVGWKEVVKKFVEEKLEFYG